MSMLARLSRAYADRVRKAVVRIKASDLTAAAHSQAIAFGDIPAEAIIIGYRAKVAVAFSDGAAGVFTVSLGDGTTAALFASALALGAIAKLVPAAGLSILGDAGDAQFTATVAAGVNVKNATAGDVTITLFYIL